MMRTTAVYSFSLSPTVVRSLEEHGRERGNSNRSALAETAIKYYLASDGARLATAEAKQRVLMRKVRLLEGGTKT